MSKVATNITIDKETKLKAQLLLKDFGMDLSTAVNVFLKQMVYEGQIPFSITRNFPNETTVNALKETEQMKQNPELYKSYYDVDKMMEDILSEV